MLNLRWINEPPVVRVEPHEVKAVADFIEADANHAVAGDAADALIDMDANQRISDICEDMRLLASDADACRDFEFYVYRIAGGSVALMSLYCPDFPPLNDGRMSILPSPGVWVEGTVGSPYASGSGIIMKEVAINISQQRGYHGCVGSAAASNEAKATWQRMGFRDTGKKYCETINGEVSEYPVMFLDPREARRVWGFLQDRWVFLPRPLTTTSD